MALESYQCSVFSSILLSLDSKAKAPSRYKVLKLTLFKTLFCNLIYEHQSTLKKTDFCKYSILLPKSTSSLASKLPAILRFNSRSLSAVWLSWRGGIQCSYVSGFQRSGGWTFSHNRGIGFLEGVWAWILTWIGTVKGRLFSVWKCLSRRLWGGVWGSRGGKCGRRVHRELGLYRCRF